MFYHALEGDPATSDPWQGGRFAYTPDGFLRYVLAVIDLGNGDVAMLKSLKHQGRFQCPGGKIDAGEDAPTALQRELMEELGTGAEIGPCLGTRKVYAGGTLWQGEYYLAHLKGEARICEPHKHAGLWRVSLQPHRNPAGFVLEASLIKPAPGQNMPQTLKIDEPAILDETYDAVALHLERSGHGLEQEHFGIWTGTEAAPDLAKEAVLHYLAMADGQRALADASATAAGRLLASFPTSELRGVRCSSTTRNKA